MTGTPLRLAVSGGGRAFERLYRPALAHVPGLAVAGVADPDGARLAGLDAGAAAAGDLESLLGRVEADAVLVLSPPAAHIPDALAALRRGLPVLVEKPACRTSAEAATLAAAGAGELLTPAFTRRAWPAYRAIHCAGGPKWRAVIGIRTDPGGWDAFSGPPPLADDLLPHAIDLARWLCRSEVASAHASGTADAVRLTLAMAGGQEVQCRVSARGAYREAARIDGRTIHVGPPGAPAAALRRLRRRPEPAVQAAVETLAAWLARINGGGAPAWLPTFADAAAVAEVFEGLDLPDANRGRAAGP